MSMLEKARAVWGQDTPEWVLVLARECDGRGLRKTSALLGISPAMSSLALSRGRENLNYVRQRVEARLMISMVGCPVFGIIELERCLAEQSAEFCPANQLKVQLYQACRSGCQHYKGEKK